MTEPGIEEVSHGWLYRIFHREAIKQRTVLALLDRDGPMYGLDMVKASGGILKRGTVYLTLGRMVDAGVIGITEEPGEYGVPRRKYFRVENDHVSGEHRIKGKWRITVERMED